MFQYLITLLIFSLFLYLHPFLLCDIYISREKPWSLVDVYHGLPCHGLGIKPHFFNIFKDTYYVWYIHCLQSCLRALVSTSKKSNARSDVGIMFLENDRVFLVYSWDLKTFLNKAETIFLTDYKPFRPGSILDVDAWDNLYLSSL